MNMQNENLFGDEAPKKITPMGDLIAKRLRSITTPKPLPRGIHSELHNLIYELRHEYGEKATKGAGSFGYYLGHLKRVPLQTIYMWRASVKQGRDIKSPGKVFWWYYRQWRASQKEEA